MWNTLHLLFCHFRRADVHSAVHLHRISGDDFAADFFCKIYRKGGLSDCGRSGEDDEGRPIGYVRYKIVCVRRVVHYHSPL